MYTVVFIIQQHYTGLVSHLLGIVTFTEVVIISLAVQKYCPILDIFLLPSVRVLVPWPSPVTGPSHLNSVAGVLLPLDQKNIAEHVSTLPPLDVMEISIEFEILPVLHKHFYRSWQHVRITYYIILGTMQV